MKTWRVISIIAENKPHAHRKTQLHTMKVYNTRPVSLMLIKILSGESNNPLDFVSRVIQQYELCLRRIIVKCISFRYQSKIQSIVMCNGV